MQLIRVEPRTASPGARSHGARAPVLVGLLLALNGEDGHPTPAGTYLAACVMYATLFGKSPVGLSYAPHGVSQDERDVLQSIAARVAGY